MVGSKVSLIFVKELPTLVNGEVVLLIVVPKEEEGFETLSVEISKVMVVIFVARQVLNEDNEGMGEGVEAF